MRLAIDNRRIIERILNTGYSAPSWNQPHAARSPPEAWIEPAPPYVPPKLFWQGLFINREILRRFLQWHFKDNRWISSIGVDSCQYFGSCHTSTCDASRNGDNAGILPSPRR